MLNEIINNPDLEEYITSFEDGRIIFLEGDDSQDLFILISGILEIIKGNKKIAEISKPGELFGEMSFLLGSNRTATVQAKEKGRALRIPKDEISSFLEKFPAITKVITRLLAQRLDETSQIVHGLKEFCDQLPDAVIITNSDGKIITWNAVAENMFGKRWEEMHYKSAHELYEEPNDYKSYIEEVQSRFSVREKILKIRHPEKGLRFISTSTTVLFDGHHNFQGVLSLGRDVTKFKEMEQKYRNTRKWSTILLLIILFAGSGLYFAFPYFSKDPDMNTNFKKTNFRNQLGKDFILIRSLLINDFEAGNRQNTNALMREFFTIQEIEETPYQGLILLDDKLQVFDFYSPNERKSNIQNMIGSSYAGIEFEGNEASLHRILTLYRADKENPMGRKYVEIAFMMYKEQHFLGWLVIQLNMEFLFKSYNIRKTDLIKFQFPVS